MGNNNTYSIIDEYIKSLYKGDKSKEVKELKEELREHLILSASELSSQGYDNEKSQNIAIEKFDGGGDMIKELYSCLSVHKSILKNITKTIGLVAIICFILVASLISYTKINDRKAMTLSDEINDKLELFTMDNDITRINNIEKKIQSLLGKELFDLEVRLANMEDENKKLNVDKNKFKLIYDSVDDKSFFEDNKNQNIRSYGGQSFLDKKGNIVNYQFFLNANGYNSDRVFGLIYAFASIEIISLIGYLILKFKLTYDKKRIFS